MTAMSILAMGMVICLFGGYVDPPKEHRIGTAARTICQMFIHKPEVNEKKNIIMNPKGRAIAALDFSRWWVSFADACSANRSPDGIVFQPNVERDLSYACWLYRIKKNTLSQARSAAADLRYESGARIAQRFASFAESHRRVRQIQNSL
jgi:hypothetical protein